MASTAKAEPWALIPEMKLSLSTQRLKHNMGRGTKNKSIDRLPEGSM